MHSPTSIETLPHIATDGTGAPREGGPVPESGSTGTVRFLHCRRWPGADYFIALPSRLAEQAPVLVTVHGISRNARAHAQTFAPVCNDLGWVVVAPLFRKSDFPHYQKLGFSRISGGPRADLALNAILDEVHDQTGAATEAVRMFGFSGGGQFVHRYAFLHPDRVRAAALGSPGWYTFPDPQTPFPRGIAATTVMTAAVDPVRALGVPTAVFVGAHDTGRDASLNTARRIDRQQGRTRLERGRRWIAAMHHAARHAGLDTPFAFEALNDCGHDFADCIRIGRLHLRALEFLIGVASRPGSRNGRRRARPSFSFLV